MRDLETVAYDYVILEFMDIIKDFREKSDNPKVIKLTQLALKIVAFNNSLRLRTDGYDIAIDAANKKAYEADKKVVDLQDHLKQLNKELDKTKEQLKLFVR